MKLCLLWTKFIYYATIGLMTRKKSFLTGNQIHTDKLISKIGSEKEGGIIFNFVKLRLLGRFFIRPETIIK